MKRTGQRDQPSRKCRDSFRNRLIASLFWSDCSTSQIEELTALDPKASQQPPNGPSFEFRPRESADANSALPGWCNALPLGIGHTCRKQYDAETKGESGPVGARSSRRLHLEVWRFGRSPAAGDEPGEAVRQAEVDASQAEGTTVREIRELRRRTPSWKVDNKYRAKYSNEAAEHRR
jgi:hypothetical protein